MSSSELIDKTLFQLFDLVAIFGLPVCVLAWIIVFSTSVGMVFVLRKHPMKGIWKASFIVGSTNLGAHFVDYYVTLNVSPDLSLEANPLWRIVVDRMGLKVALWYGLSGKILLAILSFQFFSYYLIHKESLIPQKANNYFYFWKNFGRDRISKKLNLPAMLNIFSFLFSFIGLFCFYIAFLNSVVDESLYLFIPLMPVMLLVYLIVLVLTYFTWNYWSFKKNTSP